MARLEARCGRSLPVTGLRRPTRWGPAILTLVACLLGMGLAPRPAAAQTTISGTTTLDSTLSGAYLLDDSSGAVLMTGTSTLDGVVSFAFSTSPPSAPATLAADLSGTGSLEFSGPGTLVITGSNTYSGGTVVDAGGVLEVTTGASISHAGADFIIGRTADTATLSITGGSIVSRDGFIGQDGGGVGSVTVSAGSWTNTGVLYVGAGGSTDGGGSGSLLITGGTVAADYGYIGYDGESSGDVSVSGGGTLSIVNDFWVGYSGSGTLSIGAGGTAIIGGTLGRGGAGTITLASGGTLQIGTGGVGGELRTDLANDGLVIFDQASDSSYDYAMSGSGAVTKRGTGTLTISQSHTYAGLTTIDEGALQLGDGIFTGSLAGDVVVGGGSLIFHPGSDLGYAGAISGTGGVIVRGNSVLTLSGSNSWSGGTTLQSGTLEVGGADALGTSGTIDFGGGVLRYSAGNQVDYSARIASAGGQTIAIDTNFQTVTFATGLAGAGTGLTKLGDGTLILSGSNTLSGDTVAAAGTLDVTAGGSIGPSGQLLVGTLPIQTGAFVVSGGVVDVASAIVGSNDGNGTITVTSGSLAIGGALVLGDQALSAGALNVSGGSVTAASTLLGTTSNASGSLYVDGGVFTTTGDLVVGGDGTGILTAITSGTIAVGGTLSRGAWGTIALESGGTIRIGFGGSTGTLSGDLQNNGSLVFDRADDSGYSSSLYGAGSVTKVGAGTLTLTGVNNWSGGTIVSSGTLQVGDGTAGSISGNVVNDATLAFGRSDDVTFSGIITGSGALRQIGAGTLTLDGASSYSGGTTVTAGTLAVTTGGVIDHATAPLTIGDGTTAALVVSGGTVTSGDGVVGSGASGDGSATITAGQWTNTGDLVVGRDDAVGLLSIQGGTLVVEGALTRGTIGAINLASGTLRIGNGVAGGSLGTDLVNDGALVFDGATSYGGSVTGTGTLAKQGGGTLTLSGSIGSGGGTAISGGTLDVVTGGVLDHAGTDLLVGPDGSAGALVVSGGTVSTNIGYVGYHGTGSATVSSGSWTNAGDLRIGWGLAGEPVTGPADGTFTLSGGSVSNLDAYVGVAAGSVGSAAVSDGSWLSSGTLSIGWGGGSGSIDVSGGFVGAAESRIGTGAGSTGTATVSGGVWANTGSLAIGDDGGSGSLTLTDGLVSSGMASIGSGGGSVGTATVSGGIWQATGDMVVGNDGTGSLSISGSGTVIVGGSLFKGESSGLGSGGTITLAPGGTLRIGSYGGNLATDLTADGTLVFENSADGTYGGSIDGGGRVRVALSNGITLTLSGSNAWTGGTTLESGTLALLNPEALGPAAGPDAGTIDFTGGTLQFSAGNTLDYSPRFDAAGAQAFRLDTNGQDVTLATALAGAANTLDKLGAGTLTLTADNTFTGLSTVASGTLRIGAGGLTGTLAGDVANDATLVFDRDGTLSFAGLITGTGTLVNQGPGTVELTGASAYSGATVLRAGTLALGSVGAIGATESISFEGGALAFTAANTLDSSSLFSTAAGQAYRLDTGGQGVTLGADLGTTGASLVKLGAGTLVLTGSNAFDAGTSIVEGTLSLGSSGALGSAGSVSFDGGTLQFTAANTTDSSARFSSADGQAYRLDTDGSSLVVTLASDLGSTGGTLAKLGAGTLVLTGSNAFDAGTSLVDGTLSLGSSGALGSNGTISFDGGTLQFTAANTIDSSARFGTAPDQRFRLDTDGVDVTLATGLSSSRGTLEKFGAGTLTLSGSNGYTGLTTVAAGTLRIGDGGTTGSVDGDIANDAALVFDRADGSTYSGALSGTGSLTKLGAGTLTLAGTNVFTGPLQIDAGTLALGSADALGTAGTISFGGGTLRYSASNQVDASGRISSAGAQAIRIDTAGEAVEFQSGISGGGSTLSKFGAGVLTLSGSSTYDAGTTIAGGTLDVVAGGAIAHASADLVAGTTDGDGTLLVSGGSVSVADLFLGDAAGMTGVATVNAGTLDTAGTLVVASAAGATGSLDLQGGSVTSAAATLGFAVGSSGTATVTGGTWTIAGDLRVGDGGSGTLALSGAGVTAVGGSLSQAAGSTIDLAPGGTLRIGLGGTGGQLLTDLVNHGTLVFDRSDASSFIYGVSGSGAVTKQGAGALILTGTIANPVTTVSAGTLRVGDGLVDGVITGDIVDDASLEFDTAADVTFAGAISGTGTLAKLGGATLTLTGSNSWSGGTSIDAGTLALGGSDALGTSGTIAFGGGTLRYTAANQVDYSTRISSADGQAIRIDTADQSVTYASGIAGVGSTLTVLGTGTLSLAGTNTFDGLTTVSGGVLRIGDGALSGSIVGDVANAAGVVFDRSDDSSYGGSMSGTGTLEKLGAGTLSLTGANTLTGTVTIREGTLQIGDGGSSGSLDAPVVSDGVLAFDRSGSLAYTSSVTGSGSLLKLGSGTLTLTGTAGQSGGTTVNGGTLDVVSGGGIDHAAGGIVVGSDGNAGTLGISGGTVTAATGAIGFEGTGTVSVTSGTWTTLGAIAVGSGGVSPGDGAVVVSGGSVETANVYVGLNVSGTGTMTLQGGEWVNQGGLVIGFGGGTGSLAMSGGTLTTGSASLAGPTTLASATAIVTGGTWTTTGDLVVGSDDGTGSLAISSAGVVRIGGTLSRGTLGSVGLQGGGTLQIGLGGNSGDFVGDLVNDGTLVFDRSDDPVFSNVISGSGALVKRGDGTLELTGSNSYSGGTSLQVGTLAIGGPAAIGSAGTISFDGGVLQYTALTGTDTDYSPRFGTTPAQAYKIDTNGLDVTLGAGLSSAGGTLTKYGTGTLTLTGSNTYTGLTSIESGTLRIGDGVTTGSVAGDIVIANSTATLLFDPAAGTDTFFPGVISGTGSVTKLGAGTLVLAADNTYLGTTTVSAGTLRLGDGGTIGSIRGDIVNDGTVVFDRSDDVLFAGVIEGSGALTKLGAGTLTFTGSNTYAGATTIASGTLRIGDGGVAGSITGDVANAGTLRFDRSDDVVLAGTISGTGALEQAGTGSLTLTGPNTFTGPTTIASGTLRVGEGGTGGSIVGDVANAGVLVFDRSDDTTYAGGISGVGSVTKQGAGTLTLTGSSAFSGGTTILAGGLRVGDGLTAGSLSGDVVNDGTLVFDRSDASAFDGAITGSGSLGKEGAGTLVYTGDATHAGGTTVGAGTLQIGAGGTVGSLAGDVVASGTLAFARSDAVTFTGTISGTGGISQIGTGLLTLLADNTATGPTTISSGTLALGDGGNQGSVAGDVSNAGTLVFNRSGDIVFAGAISGTGAVTKLGTGALTLTGDNGDSGPLTIESGALRIGGGGTSGAYAGDLVNRSAVVFDRSDDVTYSGAISGAGTVEKLGAGMLTLTGENVGGGLFSITTGTLRIGAGSTTGSISGDIANAGTLVFDRSDDVTHAGVISGAGTVTKQGAGMLTLTADSAGTGPLTIASGTVRIGDGGSTGTYVGAIVTAGTLVIDRAGAVTIPGAISGSGDTIIAGTGTVTLAGGNASTGLTRVQAGSLVVTASDPFAAQAGIVVEAGATLVNSGTGAIAVRDLEVQGGVESTGTRLTVTGLLSGTGSIAGNVLTTGRFQGTQTITGNVAVTGTHAPGNSPGIQSLAGSLSYELGGGSGPVVEWELDANTATNSPVAFDQVLVGMNLAFTTDTGLDLQFATPGSTVAWDDVFWSTNRQWTIWQVSGTTSGVFRLSIGGTDWLDSYGRSFNSMLPDAGFSIGFGSNGTDVVLNYVTVVPEPSTWASLLAGAAILAWQVRRRSSRRRC